MSGSVFASGNNQLSTTVSFVDLGPDIALNARVPGSSPTPAIGLSPALLAAQVAADNLVANSTSTASSGSSDQQAAVAAITLARNYILYGVAVNGAALDGIASAAPSNDVVSGPRALASAVQVAGWMAQYAQSRGYILRALTNSQIGNV